MAQSLSLSEPSELPGASSKSKPDVTARPSTSVLAVPGATRLPTRLSSAGDPPLGSSLLRACLRCARAASMAASRSSTRRKSYASPSIFPEAARPIPVILSQDGGYTLLPGKVYPSSSTSPLLHTSNSVVHTNQIAPRIVHRPVSGFPTNHTHTPPLFCPIRHHRRLFAQSVPVPPPPEESPTRAAPVDPIRPVGSVGLSCLA